MRTACNYHWPMRCGVNLLIIHPLMRMCFDSGGRPTMRKLPLWKTQKAPRAGLSTRTRALDMAAWALALRITTTTQDTTDFILKRQDSVLVLFGCAHGKLITLLISDYLPFRPILFRNDCKGRNWVSGSSKQIMCVGIAMDQVETGRWNFSAGATWGSLTVVDGESKLQMRKPSRWSLVL